MHKGLLPSAVGWLKLDVFHICFQVWKQMCLNVSRDMFCMLLYPPPPSLLEPAKGIARLLTCPCALQCAAASSLKMPVLHDYWMSTTFVEISVLWEGYVGEGLSSQNLLRFLSTSHKKPQPHMKIQKNRISCQHTPSMQFHWGRWYLSHEIQSISSQGRSQQYRPPPEVG